MFVFEWMEQFGQGPPRRTPAPTDEGRKLGRVLGIVSWLREGGKGRGRVWRADYDGCSVWSEVRGTPKGKISAMSVLPFTHVSVRRAVGTKISRVRCIFRLPRL